MKKILFILMIQTVSLLCLLPAAFAQWAPVLDGVQPLVIAISPSFSSDHSVFIADDEIRLYISEDAGTLWTLLYEAGDPWDPTQMILDVVLSPDFGNDHTMILIHKDGSCGLSSDKGQTWNLLPAPAGISGIVFSPSFATDHTLYGVTGLAGLVDFYQASNSGSSWEQVSQVFIGQPYVARIWTSTVMGKQNWFAVTVEDGAKLLVSGDGGVSWGLSMEPDLPVTDLAVSPGFGEDHTLFAATATHIWKNTEGGNPLHWTPVKSVTDGWGIHLAISTGYEEDETIYYTLNGIGIGRSTDGGATWSPFSDGFTSTLPVSIVISNQPPYTLFAGSEGIDATPDKLWKYQFPLAVNDPVLNGIPLFTNEPNPFVSETRISFETLQNGPVQLSVYDLTGKQCMELLNNILPKGIHHIDLSCSNSDLRPGVYFCRLTAGATQRVLKLVVAER